MEKETNQEEARRRFLEWQEKAKRTSLSIQRIPEEVKTEFLELAEKEFCKDYGMTLKWLMDFRKGLLSSPNEELSAKIDLLADEITNIKKSLSMPAQEVKLRKTASGREIIR